MNKVVIEWKHFEKNNKTCDRCSNTGEDLKHAISEINHELMNKGYTFEFIETLLSKDDMKYSNSILINGTPIEMLLGAIVSHNHCSSCSEIAESDCNCRTVSIDEQIYEAIPADVIKKAIYKALNIKFTKGSAMNIQVLGSGCPTCKKLHEIVQKAVSELNLDASIEYITDVSKIIEMGIMQSPVLAVNGNPVMVGFTPDIEKIKSLIIKGSSVMKTGGGCSCGGNC